MSQTVVKHVEYGGCQITFDFCYVKPKILCYVFTFHFLINAF